jgi:chromosome segregation ATPase
MSMPLNARRMARPTNVEPFPHRSVAASEVVLSARDTAAVSEMLRQAKNAIASLRERVAALESELDDAHGRALVAEERARVEGACRAAERADAQAVEQELADSLARHEALETEMTAALAEREHRMWSAEARMQELERRAAQAEDRAAAAEAREWEAKARLGRVRDALDE